jgi:hypothetical protein
VVPTAAEFDIVKTFTIVPEQYFVRMGDQGRRARSRGHRGHVIYHL